ncbi:MAG: hypothetical protein LBH44_00060 [Treponema sp.]|jgi:hypothetical protein|nr:hypothetical protein [Treponema sp.]
MKFSLYLVILSLAAVWYAIVPFTGALYSRYKWRRFRRRFDELRLSPLLNYRQYHGDSGGVFRFTGSIESITDGRTLWVKGENLTIPVSLANTKCWLLPAQEGVSPEAPERIRWNRISTLTEGAKVFVGGLLTTEDNRLSFTSTKEKPLVVIFYDCPENVLTDSIIGAGRKHNEYWNGITPVSLVMGALSLVYIAASYLYRPAFRLPVIAAIIAVFIPILPMIPPGLLFTVMYRRMAWHARNLRAYRDLALLPFRYLTTGSDICILCTGEKYGFRKVNSLHDVDNDIPILIPEFSKKKKTQWYVFGVLNENDSLPGKSIDPFVSFGALPGLPRHIALRYGMKAYTLEAAAWLVMIAGIVSNIVFIFLILYLLKLVSF